MAEETRTTSSKKELSLFAKGYLIGYNIVQGGGWGIILYRTLCYIIEGGNSIGLKNGAPGLHDKIGLELQVYQTLAFLEVIHCVIGIVPSSALLTFLQVYSRIFVLWGIIEGVPGVCDSFGLVLAILAWSITEVIRYCYYACALLGNIPYFLKYLRYTVFYILYPTGVLGELMMMYTALPVARASRQWSISLPNPCNIAFSYYYFIIFTVFLYIPIFPQLYGHMIHQRKKMLGKAKTD